VSGPDGGGGTGRQRGEGGSATRASICGTELDIGYVFQREG
jgi:hypothetical protein